MKKVFFLVMFILGVVVISFAQHKAQVANPPVVLKPAVKMEILTLKGVIIDNKTASSKKLEELASFIKAYTKQAALMPESVASGYSLFSQGKLFKFGPRASSRVEEFLKDPKNKLEVEAGVFALKKSGQTDRFGFTSMVNQK